MNWLKFATDDVTRKYFFKKLFYHSIYRISDKVFKKNAILFKTKPAVILKC